MTSKVSPKKTQKRSLHKVLTELCLYLIKAWLRIHNGKVDYFITICILLASGKWKQASFIHQMGWNLLRRVRKFCRHISQVN